MRAFIALDLPNEVIGEIRKIQKTLKKKNIFIGKSTEPDNLHLTLKFLGEIDEDKIEIVKKRLKEIDFEGFYAETGEVGVFSKSFIKIIWVKLNGKKIWELQKEIDDKLEGLFEKEERFMSHVTIARVKHVPDKKGFLEYLKSIKPRKIKFYCDRFYLKKSELKPEGPVYEVIEEYPLVREK